MFILWLWLTLPLAVRTAGYQFLRKIGARMYGVDQYNVQKLPFGLHLKHTREPDTLRNEVQALKLIQRCTLVSCPQPLDLVCSSEQAYLLMTTVPGVPLSSISEALLDSDLDDLAVDLQTCLRQIRSIPDLAGNPNHALCNTLGGPLQDHRIAHGFPIGPFVDEAAFSAMLRYPDDPSRAGHKILFTHADLNPRNIMVGQVDLADGRKGWEVTGIVDWETAGYYPEYWEYTKAMFEGFRWTARYNNMVKRVFGAIGQYERELSLEQLSWAEGDAV